MRAGKHKNTCIIRRQRIKFVRTDVGQTISLFTIKVKGYTCGRITCFVEEDVPGWEENPEGYGPLEWKGRLHCTRFARWHFEDHVNAARLAVDRFEYGRETDGQSLYVLRRR